jgi:hypothetical protein
MLVMFEPITLPTTISEECLITAKIDEMSSGNEVPKATMETPIIKDGILKNIPIFSAESIK